MRALNGNTLEGLAKDVHNVMHGEKITYLPSRANNSTDNALLSLRKNHPETFQRVIAGELSPRKGMLAARHANGERVNHGTYLVNAKSAFRNMTEVERGEFLAWIKSEFSIT